MLAPTDSDDQDDVPWDDGPAYVEYPPVGRFSRTKPVDPRKPRVSVEDIRDEDIEPVVDALLRRAAEGNMRAVKMIMDRLNPAPRGRLLVLNDIPPIASVDDVPMALQAVLAATTSGRITPAEGQSISSLIDDLRGALTQGPEPGNVEELTVAGKALFRLAAREIGPAALRVLANDIEAEAEAEDEDGEDDE